MRLLLAFLFLPVLYAQAQYTSLSDHPAHYSLAYTDTFSGSSIDTSQLLSAYNYSYSTFSPKDGNSLLGKLRQRNYGAQLGFQRGAYNFLEMGFEHHWRTISLFKPRMFSVGGSFGYNFWDNTAEYKVGVWYKAGRIALTYGANLVYATNFKQGKLGVAPVVGFRLLGFHLTTGYNAFFNGDEEFKEYNQFYVSLRYFFPIDNTFKWKKKNKGKDKKEFRWPWQKK
ncbi:hypothetical protein QNI19_01020 [Cytophagaceae bacterium DM2B3-1]|uniref:Outer membrane protein beta-barrel domain-containing protein n=1 Tax=Xanthocytophaga flava TaxID=3048013 RepID=A0ABT7CCS3_9BACT|nr:hypothetical protein [Xanthocytophaga flavus]MDJ1491488.1 hypothetical protein [Xanthocytophaga flavus]